MLIENELREAIANNQFAIRYQPKIILASGEIEGVEALIRWKHPQRGYLYPHSFLPQAEEFNLMTALSEWTIKQIFTFIKEGQLTVPVSINLSAQHFSEEYKFIDYLSLMIQDFAINTNLLEFEITERIFLTRTKMQMSILSELRRMGIKLTLDDFGVGCSSITLLKDVSVDKVKIDRSLIADIPENNESIKIIKAIFALLRTLGKRIIAEGVETYEQVQFFVNERCDEAQGYFFSKPLTLKELNKLIQLRKAWELPETN